MLMPMTFLPLNVKTIPASMYGIMQMANISETSPACSSAMLYVKNPNAREPNIALAGLIFKQLSNMYMPISEASIMNNGRKLSVCLIPEIIFINRLFAEACISGITCG